MRNATKVLIAGCCLLVAGCGSAAAGSPGAQSYGVDIQAVFDRAGNPELVANFTPDGGLAKPRWSICLPPDVTRCTPTRDRVGLSPGDVPAGTVFEATATYDGQTYSARTKPWGGRVRATVRPRLEGRPVVGAIVTPVAGAWSGGWGDEFDRRRVQACRTRDAKHCVTLSAEGEGYPGRHRRALVRRRYIGWYLFAYGQRFARDTAFALPAYGRATAVPPLKPGRTIARSAPIGPVRMP